MPSKLKIRLGQLELEYEGDSEFEKDDIKDLFTHIGGLAQTLPAPETGSTAPPASQANEVVSGGGGASSGKLAASTIAARLDVQSGSDLVIAAAAYIQLNEERESFTRKNLLETMQSAKTYYKSSMGNNLTKSLNGLIASKRINSLSNTEMSLSASELNAVKAKLAD